MIQYFMTYRNSMTVWDLVFLLLSYALLVLVILPFHEFAHAFAAHLCGDDTAKWHGRLTLNPFAHLDTFGTLMLVLCGFGFAKPVPINPRNFRHYKRDTILVSLAGPLSNLLMAVVSVGLFCLLLPLVKTKAALDILVMVFINTLLSVNVSLAVFNMLPIPPLDGSRLWSSLLPGKLAYTLERNSRYFTMALFVLLALGVLDTPLSAMTNAVTNAIFRLYGLM